MKTRRKQHKVVENVFSEEELKVLDQIYRFQKPRRFRYGLNINYIKPHNEKTRKIVEKLVSQGILWILHKYGYQYVFFTRKGRELYERVRNLNT